MNFSPPSKKKIIIPIESNIGLQIAVVNTNNNTYLHSPKWPSGEIIGEW